MHKRQFLEGCAANNIAECTLYSKLGLVDGCYQFVMRELHAINWGHRFKKVCFASVLLVPQISRVRLQRLRVWRRKFTIPTRQWHSHTLTVRNRAEHWTVDIKYHIVHLRTLLHTNELNANADERIFSAKKYGLGVLDWNAWLLVTSRSSQRFYWRNWLGQTKCLLKFIANCAEVG